MSKSKQTTGNQILNCKHSKAVVRLIHEAAYSKSARNVFSDFVEMFAISISNSVNPKERDMRERRYLDIIKSYDKRHQQLFPKMCGELVMALDERLRTSGPEDILGPIFHELGLYSNTSGQFFTPQPIADLMAMMVCGNEQQVIKEQGYIRVCEPTCGSGVMVTSMCKFMMKNGLNYNRELLVEATDIALICVHMAYIQLSLYGIPAVVIHGNTLILEEWSRWYTPVYILHGWGIREAIKSIFSTSVPPKESQLEENSL